MVWWWWGGSVELSSMQQLFKLTLFKLGIVSDLVECVHLHNFPVLEDRVQKVLEEKHNVRWVKRGSGRVTLKLEKEKLYCFITNAFKKSRLFSSH